MKRTGPGRPRLDDDSETVPVTVKMSAAEYDRTYQRAKTERVSVSEQIRADLRRAASDRKK